MNILILNAVLFTPEKNKIPSVASIKDTMIYSMCLGFLREGHKVTLIAAEEYKPRESEIYDFDIIFLKSRLKKIFKPSLLPMQLDLLLYLKKNKDQFDIIISSESFSLQTFFGVLICKNLMLIWQELFGHNRLYKKLPSLFWYNIIVRLFYKGIPIVARSQRAKHFISNYTDNIARETVDHGVNINKFASSREKSSYFVVVSQLIERKQIDLIIEQFSNFISSVDYNSYKLLVIGKGHLEESLKVLVKNLGLTKSVKFMGFMPHANLTEYVAGAKALLIYTRQDNNMVSIPEAIATGTPVLSNTVPAQSNYIRQNKLGIIRDNWTHSDMVNIVVNNDEYVQNCISIRPKLSNQFAAARLVYLFKDLRKDSSKVC